jgi:hypothetical protein
MVHSIYYFGYLALLKTKLIKKQSLELSFIAGTNGNFDNI